MTFAWRNQRSLLAGVSVVAVVLGIVAYFLLSSQPSQRQHDETSPFKQSVATSAQRQPAYVDDARCGACHDQIYDSYTAHPMGRSMKTIAELGADDARPAEKIGEFTAGPYRYDVSQREGQVLHTETRLDETGDVLATTTLPVAYAIGSAERGRSFVVDRDGCLFMSPITWYAEKSGWDLSPGYEDRNSHFNRPVIVQCLFCHANRSHPVEGALATYQTPTFTGDSIGCQRCHGPGEMHIALHDGPAHAELGETIVNPANLEPELREAVCQQCHLSGAAQVVRRGKSHYNFRPGMPLQEVLRVFVDAGGEGDQAQFVGHVEQMAASRCFQASGGEMGCISCHDPHVKPPPQARVAYFRAKCLTCHQDESCTESQDRRLAVDDNCMECHMPSRGTEIRHAAITDHRILRRPGDGPASGERLAASPAVGGIVPFHPPDQGDAEISRDTALAVLRVEDGDDVTLDAAAIRRAARDLQDAVARHPDDLAAWEGLGVAMMRLGDPAQAIRCFETVLGESPQREFSLRNAATLAKSLGRPGLSYNYWQRALAINPWIVRYRADAADALARLGQWADCEEACRQTLAYFPESNRSRQLLIESLLYQGRTDDADREFEAWLRFRPADPDQLRKWYRGHPARRQE